MDYRGYKINNVSGHYEATDSRGRFIGSGETIRELQQDIDIMEDGELKQSVERLAKRTTDKILNSKQVQMAILKKFLESNYTIEDIMDWAAEQTDECLYCQKQKPIIDDPVTKLRIFIDKELQVLNIFTTKGNQRQTFVFEISECPMCYKSFNKEDEN